MANPGILDLMTSRESSGTQLTNSRRRGSEDWSRKLCDWSESVEGAHGRQSERAAPIQ